VDSLWWSAWLERFFQYLFELAIPGFVLCPGKLLSNFIGHDVRVLNSGSPAICPCPPGSASRQALLAPTPPNRLFRTPVICPEPGEATSPVLAKVHRFLRLTPQFLLKRYL
jgi:hypothetical protein